MKILTVIGIIFLSTFLISFLVAGLIKLISITINYLKLHKEQQNDQHEELTEIQSEAAGQESELEVVAAIGLALQQYFEDVHDYEKTVMTIQKVMKPYSPWSSKIYGLRHNPRGR
ncbi:MAG: hypothetical protein HBSAPP04_16850 [Ignavibacteriaceae bacterium]|nr:MAG: hypothetical protein EDM75_07660 [Chlorobiota bacterium]GJQ32846.1 MAG: hypothetical protein HBSAPP04_16850 [Ignavibacteriaceae bacterium]